MNTNYKDFRAELLKNPKIRKEYEALEPKYQKIRREIMDKVLKRFWARVSISSNGCWEWLGYCHPNGYGRFWDGQRTKQAHRFIYEYVMGMVPDGFELDHLCRNKKCVNPHHLEVVTRKENTKRGLLPEVMKNYQLSKTHCPQGHSYNEANTYYRKDKNGRECKACRREAQRRFKLKCRI